MTELQKTLSQIAIKEQYKGLTTELLRLIIHNPEGKIDPLARNKALQEAGVRRISDIKEQTLGVIIDYAKLCLEDGVLTDTEIKNITLLKAYFGIEDGDFYKNNLQKEVKTILFEQLAKLYEDGKLDEQEALLQSETQGIFGLCYNEFAEIVKAYFND